VRKRERSQENKSLKIKYVRLQAEVKWMREVELVRLERSVLSLQDALAHVLEAVAPLTPKPAAAALTPRASAPTALATPANLAMTAAASPRHRRGDERACSSRELEMSAVQLQPQARLRDEGACSSRELEMSAVQAQAQARLGAEGRGVGGRGSSGKKKEGQEESECDADGSVNAERGGGGERERESGGARANRASQPSAAEASASLNPSLLRRDAASELINAYYGSNTELARRLHAASAVAAVAAGTEAPMHVDDDRELLLLAREYSDDTALPYSASFMSPMRRGSSRGSPLRPAASSSMSPPSPERLWTSESRERERERERESLLALEVRPPSPRAFPTAVT
jgi:hypothetical protein